MSVTPVTPTAVTTAGIAGTLGAANADGYDVTNDGDTWIEVNNGGGAPINVILTQTARDSVAGQKTIAVTNAQRRLIHVGPTDTYGSLTRVTFSDVTSVTFAAFKV